MGHLNAVKCDACGVLSALPADGWHFETRTRDYDDFVGSSGAFNITDQIIEICYCPSCSEPNQSEVEEAPKTAHYYRTMWAKGGMPWSPLPQFLEIRDSEINGRGLFATSDIEAGSVLGISHIEFLSSNYETKAGIVDSPYESFIVRTPTGAFVNHADIPNCERQKFCLETVVVNVLVALRDVAAGSELTLKYVMSPASDASLVNSSANREDTESKEMDFLSDFLSTAEGR